MSVRLAINGFGRIGRLILRASLKNPDVDVVAINDLTDASMMAHLLKYDSVHGILDCDVTAKDEAIEIAGKTIAVSSVKSPASLPWNDLEVDVVAECTGLFRKREAASAHLEAGARKVIISAPAENPDITIVMGVNSTQYDPRQHHIISNASCTTNCLAPAAKVILENFGIKSGLMTTIHAYTGDQRILDYAHKDLRRARAAGLSMIPTSTGAARAVSLVIPELTGKLNGLAVRVPTPNVSLVDFVASVEKSDISVTDVNNALKEASETWLKGILGFSDLPLVSADYNGNPLSSIVDGATTHAVGDLVKILCWYDNENGYANRMLDLAAMIGEYL
jgi:glyceraldehyde 3-phosphate dehydrogenase